MSNKQSNILAGQSALALAVVAFLLMAGREPQSSLSPGGSGAQAGPQAPPMLTSTLVAWISSQSEAIVEEMEAIARQNSASDQFSVVNYLRYLSLYENLQVIVEKDIGKLRWVKRKVKAFSRVYSSAIEILTNYLLDLDAAMSKIEANEPKSKQTEVSKAWVQHYETINYIATHVSQLRAFSRPD